MKRFRSVLAAAVLVSIVRAARSPSEPILGSPDIRDLTMAELEDLTMTDQKLLVR